MKISKNKLWNSLGSHSTVRKSWIFHFSLLSKAHNSFYSEYEDDLQSMDSLLLRRLELYLAFSCWWEEKPCSTLCWYVRWFRKTDVRIETSPLLFMNCIRTTRDLWRLHDWIMLPLESKLKTRCKFLLPRKYSIIQLSNEGQAPRAQINIVPFDLVTYASIYTMRP